MLQQTKSEEGAVVTRGRRETQKLHFHLWPWQLELASKICRYSYMCVRLRVCFSPQEEAETQK